MRRGASPAPYTPRMMTKERAESFARSWYGAWNASDLDAMMAHYSPGIEHSSPFIARFNESGEPTLRGSDAVRAYFGRALQRDPTPPGVTRFTPWKMALGTETVVLMYHRMNGEFAAEMFVLGNDETADSGKIVRSVSHYEPKG